MYIIRIDIQKKSLKEYNKPLIRERLFQAHKKGTLIFVKNLKTQAMKLQKSRSKGYKQQSGKLAQSITFTPSVIRGNQIESKVGSNSKYAMIQEKGGVITPRAKAALTIPFPGQVHPPAYALKASGNTFIRKDTIFLKVDDNIIPVYKLKRSVTLPATKWITKAKDESEEKIIRLFRGVISDA